MDVKDNIVVITGAGSGLGEATAQHLASLGAKVALLDINENAAIEIAQPLGGIGIGCDVTSEESVLAAIQKIKTTFGIPRICVNFAGILGGAKIVGRNGPHDLEEFKRVINVNLIGTFNVMRLFLDQMIKLTPVPQTEERGVVINTSSIAAFEGQIGQVAYSASKGGIASMTVPVAREMAQHAIRVVTLAPGIFETPMMQAASEKVVNGILAAALFPKRMGLPSELAAFVAHIISNPMLNGAILRIDGGLQLPAR